MKAVSIVTGGAGGMGLATAKVLGRDHHIIICDINQDRLNVAADELHRLNISCDSVVCDITDRHSIAAAFRLAVSKGKVTSVVHTAGISPQMAGFDSIMKVNALGTLYVVEAAYDIAAEGFVLVCVASMAAHMLPAVIVPTWSYSQALVDADAFHRKVLLPCRLVPKGIYRNGYSYAVSKNFVIWLCRKNAARFGLKNARIISVSPGSFDTEMGRLEEKSGSAEMVKGAALKRFGRSEEIAELLAFCASKKAGYLTGVDILCDGGVIASKL